MHISQLVITLFFCSANWMLLFLPILNSTKYIVWDRKSYLHQDKQDFLKTQDQLPVGLRDGSILLYLSCPHVHKSLNKGLGWRFKEIIKRKVPAANSDSTKITWKPHQHRRGLYTPTSCAESSALEFFQSSSLKANNVFINWQRAGGGWSEFHRLEGCSLHKDCRAPVWGDCE